LHKYLPSQIEETLEVDVGDALRAQVEERLNFFETGAPPSKNADAIRRVLDDLALEDGDEDADEEMADAEPILTTLEPTPRKEKKKKRKSESLPSAPKAHLYAGRLVHW